jgi:pyruvate formate lyase activating enzyme
MYEALEIAGRKVSVGDVMEEIEKDRIFYEQSGGGVTLSGGEPVSQPAFCEEILRELNRRNIPAALDTSGLAAWEILWRSAERADLILYDLKIMDDERHKKYTAVSNKQILGNLEKLAAAKKDIAVRIPLMKGVSDDEGNVRRTIDFLRPLKSVKNIGLLPYHKGGQKKYENLGKSSCFKIFEPPSGTRMEEIRQSFARAGFSVKIGG